MSKNREREGKREKERGKKRIMEEGRKEGERRVYISLSLGGGCPFYRIY